MFRSGIKKIAIDIPSDVVIDQEVAHNARKTLGTIQDPATEKENLNSRSTKPIEHAAKRKKMSYRSVQIQTSTQDDVKVTFTADDLTSETASEDYWRVVAEKRAAALDESFKENEKLKEQVDVLKEENKTCKEMLDESRNLIEVLKDMLDDDDDDDSTENTAVST